MVRGVAGSRLSEAGALHGMATWPRVAGGRLGRFVSLLAAWLPLSLGLEGTRTEPRRASQST